MDLAGRTLAGRYDVLELLGAGGMGSVYRAHDRELDELVALKVIHVSLASEPHIVERFRHEVKLARRVTHVNIARTFELGSDGGVMFCTMELVEGESLRQRLARVGALSVAEATAIAVELCDGLAAAHAADVVHRDIKPDNVLLANDGRVVLADFGVAAIASGGGDLSGTPAYMAPEQATGEPATPATDVYAVGVVLYEMLCNARAFRGEPTEVLAAKRSCERVRLDDVPAELARVIGDATARDRKDRIATAAMLGRLLAPWTQPDAAPAAGVRPRATHDSLHTVVVLAPRADGDESRLHVADGVHEELLRRLVKRPRTRVLPRVAGTEVPGATLVELRASDVLAVSIRHPATGAWRKLELPLDVADLAGAADAIADAIVRIDGERLPSEAVDLMLRARQIAQRSFAGVMPAVELLERASQLEPDNPRITAALAMAWIRFAVFDVVEVQGERLARAATMIEAALAAAPELAESHVAAGHLELHTGDAAVAASHFRRAIACSPYVAAAHEGLGRMLLEAGFLDVAFARLDDALAIAPNLANVRWEIARAYALEGRWAEHDRLVAELVAQSDRAFARMRFAWWRGDLATVDELSPRLRSIPSFDPGLLQLVFDCVLRGRWRADGEQLMAIAIANRTVSKRRRAFNAQLVAECAGFAGDAAAANRMIDLATDHGLYDLHWLDRCPVLGCVQPAASRTRVKRRADAILDALYGDAEVSALSDTVVI